MPSKNSAASSSSSSSSSASTIRPPSPKRSKRAHSRHMVEDLLKPDNFGPRHQKYVRKLGSDIDFNDSFKNGKFYAKYIIENLPDDPEHLLRILIKRSIDEAMELAEQRTGFVPDRIGTAITSPHLDKPVYTPMRAPNEDTAENLLNRFMCVVQSRTSKGKGNILGAPFQIQVDTCAVKALPRHQQIQGSGSSGSGQYRRKRCNPVHHRFRPQGLIFVNNSPWRPYCLFYAMELTRLHSTLDSYNFGRIYHSAPDSLYRRIHQLMKDAGIPLNQPTYDACIHGKLIIDHWNEKYGPAGQQFKMFVFEEMGDFSPAFKYGSTQWNVPIPIVHMGTHFNGVRRAGAIFEANHKYCYECLTLFRADSDHRKDCKARCINCGRVGVGRPCPPEAGFAPVTCLQCNRTFVAADCYQHHLSHECARNKRCTDCGVVWSIKDNTRDGRQGHVCGETRCINCNGWHKAEAGCFMQPLVIKKRDPYRLVSFDVECTQHEQLLDEKASPTKKLLHNVNQIVAHVNCSRCMENGMCRKPLRAHKRTCEICGTDRAVSFSVRHHKQADMDKHIQSNEPMADFLRWLLYQMPVKYTTMVYSHYGGKYDMIMAFREIFMEGMVPSMINRGNKMLQLRVPAISMPAADVNNAHQRGQRRPLVSGELIFQDSYNLMCAALGKLPGAYGLDCQDKPPFPMLANHPKNYGRTIPFPPLEDFLFDGMSPERQAIVKPWHDEQVAKGATFNLDEQLADYCWNDVIILAEALMAFRKEFMELTKPKNGQSLPIDILRDNMTISSACFGHFRVNHLKEKRLAIIPHQGYDPCDTQSRLALKFLSFKSWFHRCHIQTAMSRGGEKKVGKYKLDGYIPQWDMGIEVHGCLYHGCPCRFPDPNMIIHHKNRRMTVAKVREEDEARLSFLRSKLRGGVQVFWECEIYAMERECPMLRRFMKRCQVPRPLRLRDCFFGGRTGPMRMHYKCPPGYKMAYYDFCSLYPSVMATTAYPIGHPKLHIMEGPDRKVNWTRPEDVPVNGILNVHVVPPEHCDVPVLPAKFNDGRLLFPLCRTCATDYPQGAVMPRYSCPHYDPVKRGWEGLVTSIELREALAVGYRVDEYFRSYEWEEWDDTVFRGYIAEMMEMKIHASGFPIAVAGKREKEDQFIRECDEKFGIKIEREKMRPNKARRAIAKLMANNLWGRFALRCNLTKCHITNSPAEYRRFHENPTLQINRADELTPDIIMMSYEVLDEFVEENASSNVMISAWTTAAARIKLLHEMQKVVAAGGILLYTDTDSIIFAYKESEGCPLETGDHIGELTDEYPDYDLVEFVSSGCKAYGIQMRHKVTGEIKIVMRLRGITLTGSTSRLLHFDTFKRCVFEFGKAAELMEADGNGEAEIELLEDLSQRDERDWTIQLEYPNFIQANIAKGHVTSRPMTKRYRPIVSKGIVTKGLIIKDFGAR